MGIVYRATQIAAGSAALNTAMKSLAGLGYSVGG